ncbi:MAG: SET domain-containing protein-lysine N-methyltransferase [Chitinophagaceae bacterium]|nr:SET domain-containing protein-lysine N-methyltransferase [Chitinophagaceae bacterium]
MLLFKHLFRRDRIEKAAGLYAGESLIHGRGVFTTRSFKPGEVIERAPLVLLNTNDSEFLADSSLYHYYFMVENPKTPVAFGFGFSSLYNHAFPSNARYRIDLDRELIIITAHRPIRAGEEVTINYHGDPEDGSPVSFTNPGNSI